MTVRIPRYGIGQVALGMGDEVPADLGTVRYAFRLGWALAETRGRFRPDRYDARDPGHPAVFKRNGWGLPLANERSPAEIRRELIDTIEDLTGAIELKDTDSQERWTALKVCLTDLETNGADRTSKWSEAAHHFYQLDAHIQDALVLDASQAAAYQLGRGLAETFGALERDAAPDNMGSWRFVLGPERCGTVHGWSVESSQPLGPSVRLDFISVLNRLVTSGPLKAPPSASLRLLCQGGRG